VLHTRGAVPRHAGSRMLVGRDWTDFSIGGGTAEQRVVLAARALLADRTAAAALGIDLGGGPGADGVCGGRMQLALRRWDGRPDSLRASEIARALSRGEAFSLHDSDLAPEGSPLGDVDPRARAARPNPRLLIVGAGHCSRALAELARPLDFDLWVFDPDATETSDAGFTAATVRRGEWRRLAEAFDSARPVHAVLLTRDFRSDIAALQELVRHPLAFLGMMGSSRRIHEVRSALPHLHDRLAALRAPVGIEIGAETPHEIAISILAQLVAVRRGATAEPD
jgi:xanthine dehydrogenase accessory factor